MKNLKFSFSIVLIILAVGVNVVIWSKAYPDGFHRLLGHIGQAAGQEVSAKEIYPIFFCPCCGKPLDPANICCQDAKERIGYIDSLVKTKGLEKEIVLAYAQKYCFNTFIDQNKAKEFKEELAKAAPDDRPIISINPISTNLGDVSQKKGIVTTLFELKNEGKSDLIIDKLDSSCGCTSAAIIFEGKEGPRFAMAGHGTENPTDWQVTIPAGKTGQIKVYYDPNIHQDLRGPVIREIYIYSNDPIDFEKRVQIELNQVD